MGEDAEKPFDLGERTAQFGEAVIDFAMSVQRNPVSSPLISQLVRSATSVGLNYCEAEKAGSRKEFKYRLSVCKRESRETKLSLRYVVRAAPVKKEAARPLCTEAHELNRIFAAIHRKTKDE